MMPDGPTTPADLERAQQQLDWARTATATARQRLADRQARQAAGLDAAEAGRLEDALADTAVQQALAAADRAATACRQAVAARNRCRSRTTDLAIERSNAAAALAREAAARLADLTGALARHGCRALLGLHAYGSQADALARRLRECALECQAADRQAELTRAQTDERQAEAALEAVRTRLVEPATIERLARGLPEPARALLVRLARDSYRPKPATVARDDDGAYRALQWAGCLTVTSHGHVTITSIGAEVARWSALHLVVPAGPAMPLLQHAAAWRATFTPAERHAMVGRARAALAGLAGLTAVQAADPHARPPVEVGDPAHHYSYRLVCTVAVLGWFVRACGEAPELAAPDGLPVPPILACAHAAADL